jgi:transposase
VKTINLDNLPAEVDVLQDLVRTLAEALDLKDTEIAALRHRLALFCRHQFGSRSERMDPAQLKLAFLAMEEEAAPPEPPPAPAAEEPKKKGHGRRRLPRELPRVREEHTLPPEAQVCAKCGGALHHIGEEVSDQVDYHPANLFIREHARQKYACTQCQESVVLAPMPQQPIEKGLPGPGLIAHVVVNKFDDHLPWYRQEHIFERYGLKFSRSTQSNWASFAADLIEPLVKKMTDEILQSFVIHTDDTTVRVLDEAYKKTTRTGRLWAYLGDEDHPYTVFEFTPTREKKWPEAFLGDWRGYLQADAYAGYNAMFVLDAMKEVACWAHARRKFFEAQKTDGARAAVALTYIKRLYKVEREATDRGLDPAGRLALRHEKARPDLEALHAWLLEQVGVVLPKNPLGEAIGYALDQWAALTRYLDDGRLDIDNNAAENALRRVAVGRKNWLFVGSDDGGRRAAIFYSIIETCRRHGVEPFAYLRDILGRISTHPARDIAALLPPNWKKEQEALRQRRLAAPSAPDPPPNTS